MVPGTGSLLPRGCGITDTCKNIFFLQLRLRAVNRSTWLSQTLRTKFTFQFLLHRHHWSSIIKWEINRFFLSYCICYIIDTTWTLFYLKLHSTHWKSFFLLFIYLFIYLNFLLDTCPFFGATDTPVSDFWWCLLWVSKPEWVLPYSNFVEAYVIYVPWDSPLVRHLCWCIWPA